MVPMRTEPIVAAVATCIAVAVVAAVTVALVGNQVDAAGHLDYSEGAAVFDSPGAVAADCFGAVVYFDYLCTVSSQFAVGSATGDPA